MSHDCFLTFHDWHDWLYASAAESPRPTSDEGGAEAGGHGSSMEMPADKPKPEANKSKKKVKTKTELPPVLKKKKPVGDWCGPKELLLRELGLCGKKQPQSFELFRSKFYGSL